MTCSQWKCFDAHANRLVDDNGTTRLAIYQLSEPKHLRGSTPSQPSTASWWARRAASNSDTGDIYRGSTTSGESRTWSGTTLR